MTATTTATTKTSHNTATHKFNFLCSQWTIARHLSSSCRLSIRLVLGLNKSATPPLYELLLLVCMHWSVCVCVCVWIGACALYYIYAFASAYWCCIWNWNLALFSDRLHSKCIDFGLNVFVNFQLSKSGISQLKYAKFSRKCWCLNKLNSGKKKIACKPQMPFSLLQTFWTGRSQTQNDNMNV